MIQNKVILQERFFAESKRVADCIYSYGTQSRADMTLAVTLTGIFVTNWIMRLFATQFYILHLMKSSIHYKMLLASENV